MYRMKSLANSRAQLLSDKKSVAVFLLADPPLHILCQIHFTETGALQSGQKYIPWVSSYQLTSLTSMTVFKKLIHIHHIQGQSNSVGASLNIFTHSGCPAACTLCREYIRLWGNSLESNRHSHRSPVK